MHSSKTREPGPVSTLHGGILASSPQAISRRPGPSPSHLQGGPSRGWGSGTLPSQLSLMSYLVALGPAPPSGRWDAAGGKKSGKELAEPWGPASLPSPPPIRGWRGRRHACALSASKRLQRGKMWKEGMAEPPSWHVNEQARSFRPKDPRKVHIWKDVVNRSVCTSLLFSSSCDRVSRSPDWP